MTVIADLHIHSKYSRATSRDLNPETLYVWAQLKGVNLIGTGDFTHPEWLRELEDKVEAAEDGLWKLKPSLTREVDPLVPHSCRGTVRFVFQAEISTIYKKAGRTRKVHHLILLPSPHEVRRLSARLERIGNLKSDGRPILGLDSRDLLEMVLEVSDLSLFIPAHIWTPWFSVFGSKSGFDALEECYGELTPYIAALETGLSSDPEMNWRWSKLDGHRLVSNSDAHSPSRLGREANLLDISLSYPALREALFSGKGFLETIEFFPEEGKYHLDGHRKCGTRLDPSETRANQGQCPACGRPVTIGVMHRVESLGDRPRGITPSDTKPFTRLLPLEEILGEIMVCGSRTRRVQVLQRQLLDRWGPELHILRELPLRMVEEGSIPLLTEALKRMREGRVWIEAGFDGQYGKIRLFRDDERASLQGQRQLLKLTPPMPDRPASGTEKRPVPSDSQKLPEPDTRPLTPFVIQETTEGDHLTHLNTQQRAAVLQDAPFIMILAGPGTGKTLTLTHRIAHFLWSGRARPEEILAVTFTNRAAQEMKERLKDLMAENSWASQLKIQTLHAFGYQFLRGYWEILGWEMIPFLLEERARMRLLVDAVREECPGISTRSLPSLMAQISQWKQSPLETRPNGSLVAQAAEAYEKKLRQKGAVDYDDLLRLPLHILITRDDLRAEIQRQVRFLFVDEYQDLNALQVRLLKYLCPQDGNLTVIGDPDQSIYGFRGAEVGHFFDFQKEFPDAQILRLEDNYRSTGTIVEAALQVISRNPLPYRRELISRRGLGALIRCHAFDTEKAEAIFVAQEIGQLLGGTSHWAMNRSHDDIPRQVENISFGDIAILYRLHAVSGLVEETLSKEGVPYQRYGERPLRGQSILQGLMASLRWILDPRRDEDLLTSLAIPSVGVSDNTIETFRKLSLAEPGALWERIASGGLPPTLDPSEAKRIHRHLRSLVNLLDEAKSAPTPQVVRQLTALLRIRIPTSLSSWDPAAEILKRCLAAAEQWQGDLLSFLDLWSLQEEGDLYDPRSDRVALMSIHAAKGLEFSVVFLMCCEEGLFPHLPDEDGDLEEERRLFFVAITRARDLLYISQARSRTLWGRRLQGKGSRFLNELPPSLVCHEEGRRPPPRRPAQQLKLF